MGIMEVQFFQQDNLSLKRQITTNSIDPDAAHIGTRSILFT